MPKTIREWGMLVLFVALCHLAGIIGSIFTFEAIPTWYATLTKPSFSPPNWLFGPVWTTLYTLMGISVYIVWQKRGEGLRLFFIHLFFNALWSVLFFGLKNPSWALVDIVVLWVFMLMVINRFFRTSKVAGWLLVPYLAWVTFASVLNAAIVFLN